MSCVYLPCPQIQDEASAIPNLYPQICYWDHEHNSSVDQYCDLLGSHQRVEKQRKTTTSSMSKFGPTRLYLVAYLPPHKNYLHDPHVFTMEPFVCTQVPSLLDPHLQSFKATQMIYQATQATILAFHSVIVAPHCAQAKWMKQPSIHPFTHHMSTLPKTDSFSSAHKYHQLWLGLQQCMQSGIYTLVCPEIWGGGRLFVAFSRASIISLLPQYTCVDYIHSVSETQTESSRNLVGKPFWQVVVSS